MLQYSDLWSCHCLLGDGIASIMYSLGDCCWLQTHTRTHLRSPPFSLGDMASSSHNAECTAVYSLNTHTHKNITRFNYIFIIFVRLMRAAFAFRVWVWTAIHATIHIFVHIKAFSLAVQQQPSFVAVASHIHSVYAEHTDTREHTPPPFISVRWREKRKPLIHNVHKDNVHHCLACSLCLSLTSFRSI